MSDFGDAIMLVWYAIVIAATFVLALLLSIIAFLLGFPFWYGVIAAVVIAIAVILWSRS